MPVQTRSQTKDFKNKIIMDDDDYLGLNNNIFDKGDNVYIDIKIDIAKMLSNIKTKKISLLLNLKLKKNEICYNLTKTNKTNKLTNISYSTTEYITNKQQNKYARSNKVSN